MDIDPLQDTVPPRYALESDEEEDEFNPLRPTVPRTPSNIDISLKGKVLEDAPLVIANARAGAFWARGADLGEHTGAVYVNNIQVGLLFKPAWAAVTVLVSESFTHLPLDFMHPYAKYILDHIKPTRASILDSYSFPTYSSLKPTSLLDAPIRFLTTDLTKTTIQATAPFEPPNLLQSTSAAFLLLLRLRTIPATLLLLPSAQLPIPAPKSLSPSNFPSSPDHQDTWPASVMTLASKELLKVDIVWKPGPSEPLILPKKLTSEIGEGGMYL